MIDNDSSDLQKQIHIDEHNNSSLSIYSDSSLLSIKKSRNATSPLTTFSCRKKSNKIEYLDKNNDNEVLSDDANLNDEYDEYNNDNDLERSENFDRENNKLENYAKKNDESSQKISKKTPEFSIEKLKFYESNENPKISSTNNTNSNISSSFSINTKSNSSGEMSISQQKLTSSIFQPFVGSVGSTECHKQNEERFKKNSFYQNQSDFLRYVKSPNSLEGVPLPCSTAQLLQSNQQPEQSTSLQINNHSNFQSFDSLCLMERIYSNPSLFGNILFKPPNGPLTQKNSQNEANKIITASQQALLTQYASNYNFYLNNNPNGLPLANVDNDGFNSSRMAIAAAMAANYHFHSAKSHDFKNLSEKEKYLASLSFSNAGSSNVNYCNNSENNVKGLLDRDDSIRNRKNSSGSRSPSPSSSQNSGNCCEDDDDEYESQSINANNGEWTYEEQFKQLYELSDEPKRKEFLDDLFAFMQKRGSPVNRIPIMAKHVLDLYELYRLVVSKGGLVEVINKKLWREITKGLNLPSSITSAAFTLRTQYMKYLYPYECEKLKMSTPQELQSAIDGNRREGRRPVYGFDYPSPNPINQSVVCSGISGHGSISSNSTNITNSSAIALNIVKSSSLQNNLMNVSGLSNQINSMNLHQNQNHRLDLKQQSQNPHHAAFLAAAAVAAVHHENLYDPSSLHTHQFSQLNLAQNPANIPTFLKSYFELNTPPSSSSSSISSNLLELTSSKENQFNRNLDKETSLIQKPANRIINHNNTSDNISNISVSITDSISLENNNNEKNIINKNALTSLKRPFDQLDTNSDNTKIKCDIFKESQSKKQVTENFSNDKNKIAVNLNPSSNSNKIKIISKDIIQNNDSLTCTSEKSISLSIEINGNLYHGTLYSSTSSSLSPSNSNFSAPLSSESTINSHENSNIENSVKGGLVF